MNDKDTKELVRAVKELVREMKKIRKLMESRDKNPEVSENETDEYML